MALDVDGGSRAWLALSCAPDGTIVRVLRDDFGFAREGALLSEVVDTGSASKAEMLVAELRDRAFIVGWELNVRDGSDARPLRFAGAAAGDSLVIFAAPVAHGGDTRLYEELSRLNNEVINRERELARKGAALERLSADRNRVIAIAAHDLRNPLTIVAAYAGLLLREAAVSGDHALYVEEISNSARFMMQLVEEMLDSTLLESRRKDLDLQTVDLIEAGRHAATINRVRAERKGITVAFETSAERALIRADAVKLRRIVNNLVVNAIKFSPPNTTVTVRVRVSGSNAIFDVLDEGVGIPAEKLGLIFEPFRTLGETGTAGEKSTGLGLAIVKQLAELHGATVRAESEVGRGSTFSVSFPATDTASRSV